MKKKNNSEKELKPEEILLEGLIFSRMIIEERKLLDKILKEDCD